MDNKHPFEGRRDNELTPNEAALLVASGCLWCGCRKPLETQVVILDGYPLEVSYCREGAAKHTFLVTFDHRYPDRGGSVISHDVTVIKPGNFKPGWDQLLRNWLSRQRPPIVV